MNQKASIYSQFKRLGNRNYVQGSDLIYEAILAANKLGFAKQPTYLKASCKKIINQSGYYEVITQPNNSTQKQYSSLFTLGYGSNKIEIGLSPSTDTTPLKSVEYDEEKLIAFAKIITADRVIKINWSCPKRTMRYLIALQKKLLNTITPPKKNEPKWIFCQCELNWERLKTEAGTLTIAIKSLVGSRAANCSILLNDKMIGSQYFTRARQ